MPPKPEPAEEPPVESAEDAAACNRLMAKIEHPGQARN